jgi:hypothetical protein
MNGWAGEGRFSINKKFVRAIVWVGGVLFFNLQPLHLSVVVDK